MVHDTAYSNYASISFAACPHPSPPVEPFSVLEFLRCHLAQGVPHFLSFKSFSGIQERRMQVVPRCCMYEKLVGITVAEAFST